MKPTPFFTGLWYLVLLNMLIKPVWIFGIDRQIQNVVGFEAYGAYFAVLNLSIVFSFLADAGLSTAVNQKVAAGGVLPVRQLLKVKALLTVCFIAVVCTTAWLTGVPHWSLVLLTAGIQAATSLFVFLRQLITAHQLFKTDAWLSVVDKVVLLIFCTPFLYFHGLDTGKNIQFFLSLQLGATLLAIALAALVVSKNALLPKAEIKEQVAVIFKTVAPFAGIILLMSAHNRLDAFLLERLHTDGALQAGIYAAAYRLLDAANVAGYLVGSFLVPFVARRQQQPVLISNTVLATRHFLMAAAILVVTFTVVFAQPVLQWLYHHPLPYAATVLQLTIAVLPALYLTHIYSSVLTATAGFKPLLPVLAAAVLLNTVANLFLIPAWGAAGSAASALVSQYGCALLLYVLATKKTRLQYGGASLLVYLLAALIITMVYLGGQWAGLHPLVLLGGVVLLLLSVLLLNMPLLKKYFVLLRSYA